MDSPENTSSAIVVPQQLLEEGHDILLMLTGDVPGRTFTLDQKEALIGRAVDAAVSIQAIEISRRHALLVPLPEGGYVLRDLGSRNGTKVNGVDIGEKKIELGDRITLGNAVTLAYSRADPQTEELKLAERLESIRTLAGGVAHEFNNLLAVLRSNVSYLRGLPTSSTLGDPGVVAALSDGDEAAKRAMELVRDLLAFARGGRYDERPVHISLLVTELARVLERSAARTVRIESEVEPDLAVIGDRAQLRQALMCLCTCAIEAMPHGGTLWLGARSVPEEVLPVVMRRRGVKRAVRLTVRDTGPGLDEESRRRVFEPFFSREALGIGSGLGLAMVYGVIRGHGGEITAESELDSGTTFRAFLPAGTMHQQHPTPVLGSTLVPVAGQVRRALVVDDEAMVRRGITRLLEQLGYETIEASGGRQAIEIFRAERGRVDLVILDLMMPQMSGEETFRELQAIDPGVRVLVSSGYSQDEHAHDIMRAGARVFLQKPYDLEALRAAVARALAS